MTNFIFLLTCLFLLIMMSFSKYNTVINNKFTIYSVMIVMIIINSAWIGFRKVEMFPDTSVYIEVFNFLRNDKLTNVLDYVRFENGFVLFQWIITKLSFSVELSLYIVFLVFLLIFIIALNKLFKEKTIFIVFCYINYPFFISMGGNIIRHGLSIAFLLLGIAILISKSHKKTLGFYLALLFSSIIHYSAIPLVITLIFINITKLSLKKVTILWGIFSIAFLLKIPNYFLGTLTSIEQINMYMSEGVLTSYGNLTYRIDFFLFSLIFLVLGLIISKYILVNKDENYKSILKIYTIFNIYFLLMSFMPYSDRFGIFSWIFVPIIIFYPVMYFNKRYPFLIATFMIVSFVVFSSINYRLLFNI